MKLLIKLNEKKGVACLKFPEALSVRIIKRKGPQAIFYPGCRSTVCRQARSMGGMRRGKAQRGTRFSPTVGTRNCWWRAMQETGKIYLKRICKRPSYQNHAFETLVRLVLRRCWSFIPKSGRFFYVERDGSFRSQSAVNQNSLKSSTVDSQNVFDRLGKKSSLINFQIPLPSFYPCR